MKLIEFEYSIFDISIKNIQDGTFPYHLRDFKSRCNIYNSIKHYLHSINRLQKFLYYFHEMERNENEINSNTE